MSARGESQEARHRTVLATLYAFVGIFYASNMYQNPLQNVLYDLKWFPLLFLLVLSLDLASKPGDSSAGVGISLPLGLLAAIAPSVFFAADVAQATLYFAVISAAIAASWLVAWYIDKLDMRAEFFRVIEVIGRIVIVSGAVMWPLGLNWGRAPERFSGWTDNPNTIAELIAPAAVVMLAGVIERKPGWMTRHGLYLAVGMLVIVASGSRASMLWVLGGAVGFWLVRRGVGAAMVLGFVALVAGAVWFQDLKDLMVDYFRVRNGMEASTRDVELLSGRSFLWALGADLWRQNPWFGYGPGSAKGLIDANPWIFMFSSGEHFHNSYLEMLVENGIVGLTGLLAVVSGALVTGYRRLASIRLRYGGRLALVPDWPTRALPFAMVTGALSHAVFETWLVAAGNENMVIFWVCIWFMVAPGRGEAIPERSVSAAIDTRERPARIADGA